MADYQQGKHKGRRAAQALSLTQTGRSERPQQADLVVQAERSEPPRPPERLAQQRPQLVASAASEPPSSAATGGFGGFEPHRQAALAGSVLRPALPQAASVLVRSYNWRLRRLWCVDRRLWCRFGGLVLRPALPQVALGPVRSQQLEALVRRPEALVPRLLEGSVVLAHRLGQRLEVSAGSGRALVLQQAGLVDSAQSQLREVSVIRSVIIFGRLLRIWGLTGAATGGFGGFGAKPRPEVSEGSSIDRRLRWFQCKACDKPGSFGTTATSERSAWGCSSRRQREHGNGHGQPRCADADASSCARGHAI